MENEASNSILVQYYLRRLAAGRMMFHECQGRKYEVEEDSINGQNGQQRTTDKTHTKNDRQRSHKE